MRQDTQRGGYTPTGTLGGPPQGEPLLAPTEQRSAILARYAAAAVAHDPSCLARHHTPYHQWDEIRVPLRPRQYCPDPWESFTYDGWVYHVIEYERDWQGYGWWKAIGHSQKELP